MWFLNIRKAIRLDILPAGSISIQVLLDLLNEKQTKRSMFELEVKESLHVALNKLWIACPTATGNFRGARIFAPLQSIFPY